MAHWKQYQLGDCLTLMSGGTPSKARNDYWDGDIPWISCKDMKAERIHGAQDYLTPLGAQNGTRVVPANTIVFVVRGMILAREFPVAMTKRVVAFNQDLKAAKPAHFIDNEFLFQWLRANTYEILGRVDEAGHGTTRIQTDRLLSLPISVPPLSIQRRIARILSAYDDLIENNQRRIRILEGMARSLYREWFAHFRYPGYESIPLVESPLGKIPQGWEVKNIGDVAVTFRGRSYRSVDLAVEGGIPFLNLKCLDRDGGFRRSGLKRYIGDFKEAHLARKGDIVMAVTDMTQERRIIARAALVPSLNSEFGVFSMDLVRIEPKGEMQKSFLYSFFRYSSFADEVKQHANGANVLHLSPERITDFRFSVPPADLMERFVRFVAPSLEQMDVLQNQTTNLRCTRDLLLPRLMSGQIDVTTTETLIEEAIA